MVASQLDRGSAGAVVPASKPHRDRERAARHIEDRPLPHGRGTVMFKLIQTHGR